jgi:hypothetical protein
METRRAAGYPSRQCVSFATLLDLLLTFVPADDIQYNPRQNVQMADREP